MYYIDTKFAQLSSSFCLTRTHHQCTWPIDVTVLSHGYSIHDCTCMGVRIRHPKRSLVLLGSGIDRIWRVVGPTNGLGGGGGVSPLNAKCGSSETIGTSFCIENMYRLPYTFESTHHCQVHLRSLCAHVKALSRASCWHSMVTSPCRTGKY